MSITPSKEDFLHNASAGRISPVYLEIPYLKPQELFQKIEGPHSFLLESIKGPENIARYSFLGRDPVLVIKVKDGAVQIKPPDELPIYSASPLRVIKDLMKACPVTRIDGLPPFTGGAVGLISYDFVHYLEKLPDSAVDDLDIPDADFMIIDTLISVDHKLRKAYIISNPGAEDTMTGKRDLTCDWDRHYDQACERITKLNSMIAEPGIPRHPLKLDSAIEIRHEMSKARYMEIVTLTKEYIRAGDIFQANLSQRVSADIGDVHPWEVYKLLSSINPAPFAAYLDMGDYHIASSSPERLVKVSGREVETRPIAGTRPRGIDAEADLKMRTDLLLNEKERAEHLMMIDLERNDLGKISDYSSVKVDEQMITEEYSHVIHIVSNIKGVLAEGKDCFDAIRATFPGGTITGVPKVRCMEIIDELEPVVRGPYTGSIGYIGFTGDMDLNIIIRTFVIKDSVAYVQAGAGIVADSDPEREYYETLKKAEALIKTLEML
ncbi:MAG: anthranilate synthase component I family protein [Nitrospira sp.]|nr:anthranilate synthase component I family protein [bacterium]MBL7049223.1 anthranilate synthase component I family protein [Nitrospira sp.]